MYFTIGLLLAAIIIVVWTILMFINLKGYLDGKKEVNFCGVKWAPFKSIEGIIMVTILFIIIALLFITFWPIIIILSIVLYKMYIKDTKEKDPPLEE